MMLLLEELRATATHESLGETIDSYLSANSIDDLYMHMFRRFEQLYETDLSGLVGNALRLLWASRGGLSETEFTFLGFLPHKKGRQTALKGIATEMRAIVLFESPHRILKLLKELSTFAPDKKVSVAKELTKIHEAVFEGAPDEIVSQIQSAKADRGEFVVVIHSKK